MFTPKKKRITYRLPKNDVLLIRHGSGKMMFSSGAVYEGQWQFDKMTGYGTLKLPDGTIQRGTRKEGSLQGCAVFRWPDGVTEYRELVAVVKAGLSLLFFKKTNYPQMPNESVLSAVVVEVV